MGGKTNDIEFVIATALDHGPLTLDGLEAGGRFEWLDDRRWLAVALGHMVRDGRITSSCNWDRHNHDGSCTLKAVAP